MSIRVSKWKEGRKEGKVLFNDARNTFYLRLYGVRHNGKGPFRYESSPFIVSGIPIQN